MPNKTTVLLAFMLIVHIACAGQDSIIIVERYPVKSGYIKLAYDNYSSYHDFADYVDIVAYSDTALVMYDSKVTDLFSIDSSLFVIMSVGKKRSVVYGNLSSINVAKGDVIKKGQMIGFIQPDTNAKFSLLIKLMDGSNEVSYEKHLSLFRNRKY